MVMSQGTYTFLACFGGFWLVWAMVVLLCCLCSFLQRRLKRMREERHREQCLRSVETESLSCQAPSHANPAPTVAPAASRDTPHICPSQLCTLPAVSGTAPPLHVPHPLPQANWVTMPADTDVFGKPPCYEEAVLMEDPPPPYCEVLADPRGGTYLKPGVLRQAPSPAPAPCPIPAHSHHPPVTNYPVYSESKPPPVFVDRGYSSLIRLPSSQRWDSLGHLLSNMDLNHNHLTPPTVRSLQAAGAMATMPRRDIRTPYEVRVQTGYSSLQGRTNLGGHRGLHRARGLEPNCGLPTAFPLLGRSTAV